MVTPHHWEMTGDVTPRSNDATLVEHELIVFARRLRAALSAPCAIFIDGQDTDAFTRRAQEELDMFNAFVEGTYYYLYE